MYSIRTHIFRGSNYVLAAIEATYGKPGLHEDISKKEMYSKFNDIFTSDGLK